MLEIMFEVTRNVVVLVIAFSILEMFLPRGEFRPFLNMVAGLLLLLTLLTPFWMLRQLPQELALPASEPAGILEKQTAGSLSRLEQLNQGLTLERYQELVVASIRNVLLQEELQVVAHSLEMVTEPAHPAYGQLLAVQVLAGPKVVEAQRAREISEIRITLEGRQTEELQESREWPTTAGNPDRRLTALLARHLGLSEEKVEVRVLKQ